MKGRDFQIGAGLYAVGRPVQKRNDEDGQIGTIQSLPLERGALFNRFFGEPAHGPPHVAGGASGPIGGCRDESRTENQDLDLRHVFDIVLNTNTLTRIPTNRNQQATSPDISTASNTIYNNITWSTLNALNSDHNPIKISYNTKTKFRLIQHRRSYTNYRKADWQGFTNSIENALTDTTDVTDVHK